MRLPIRVDKYLRDSTTRRLKELREACAHGRVMIHSSDSSDDAPRSVIAVDPGTLVYPGEAVTFDARRVEPRTLHDYLMLHKSIGVTTTTRDPDGQEDLSGWLARMPPGVFPVGRLDRMTSGLLLLTNDGDLAQALLLPAHHVEKRYQLSVVGVVPEEDSRLLALERGVPIAGDERAASARVIEALPNGGTTTVTLGLRQGRHRQVRKMCHAVSLRLLALHRVAVGSLELGELAPGEFRSLDSSEVDLLWSDVGGHHWIRARQLTALRQGARVAASTGAPDARLERWLESAAIKLQ